MQITEPVSGGGMREGKKMLGNRDGGGEERTERVAVQVDDW
jgi:hypothetical protein